MSLLNLGLFGGPKREGEKKTEDVLFKVWL